MPQGAPRLYVNLAIIAGGLVGLILQHVLNMDDLEAFVLTAVCCSIGAALVHIGWIINERMRRS